ncbi:MAG: hypothetical protein GXP10_01715 [Gammaproteobacteria bacterium]|nr:hypothetical protein [Gammaproteobacteria bacterium]
MAQGIECLLSDDPGVASEMAQKLDSLNRERRSIENEMRQQALSALDVLDDTFSVDSDAIAAGLCLYDESWHQGVIGILASRIKEKLHRPVIAFAPSTEAGEIKGSARSVPGVHVKDVLEAIAAQHPDMLKKFGGHAMAAGLTLASDHFEPFKQAFNEAVLRQLDGDELKGVMLSDGELTANQLNLELAETLRNAAPWGQGFSEPLFDGVFEVVSQRVVGENHLKITLRVAHDSRLIDAIAFNVDDTTQLEGVNEVHLVYKLDVNEYRGQRTAQLIIDYIDL